MASDRIPDLAATSDGQPGDPPILLAWVDMPPERVRVLPIRCRTSSLLVTCGGLREAAEARQGPDPADRRTSLRTSATRGTRRIFSVLAGLRAKFPDLIHVRRRRRRRQAAPRIHRRGAGAGAVRFLGFVPDADLPDLYRLADLYVMPSTEEGFGIVYLEAAACGLRVVGGKGGGTATPFPTSASASS